MATSGRLRGEPPAERVRASRRELPRRRDPDLAQLAEALEELRRWYDHEVARERATLRAAASIRETLPVLRPDLEGWDLERAEVGAQCDAQRAVDESCRGRWPRRPPDTLATMAYEREIERAARGQRHAPIEWLWLLHVDEGLDDDELASILSPAHHRRDRAAAIRAVAEQRRRARRWLEDMRHRA